MKAKAMKKTLSCILALTLTASMMAESLTAFATSPQTGSTSISGNGGAPEDVEDDEAPLPDEGMEAAIDADKYVWKDEAAMLNALGITETAVNVQFVGGAEAKKTYDELVTRLAEATAIYKAVVLDVVDANMVKYLAAVKAAASATFAANATAEALTTYENKYKTVFAVNNIGALTAADGLYDKIAALVAREADLDALDPKADGYEAARAAAIEAISAAEEDVAAAKTALLAGKKAAMEEAEAAVPEDTSAADYAEKLAAYYTAKDAYDDAVEAIDEVATAKKNDIPAQAALGLAAASEDLNLAITEAAVYTAQKANEEDSIEIGETENSPKDWLAITGNGTEAGDIKTCVDAIKDVETAFFANNYLKTTAAAINLDTAMVTDVVVKQNLARKYSKTTKSVYAPADFYALVTYKKAEDFYEKNNDGSLVEAAKEMALADFVAYETAVNDETDVPVDTKVTNNLFKAYFYGHGNVAAAAAAYAEEKYSLYSEDAAEALEDTWNTNYVGADAAASLALVPTTKVAIRLDDDAVVESTTLVETYDTDHSAAPVLAATAKGKIIITATTAATAADAPGVNIATLENLSTVTAGDPAFKVYAGVASNTYAYDGGNVAFTQFTGGAPTIVSDACNVNVAAAAAVDMIDWSADAKTAVAALKVYKGMSVIKALNGLNIDLFNNDDHTHSADIKRIATWNNADDGNLNTGITVKINVYDSETNLLVEAASKTFVAGQESGSLANAVFPELAINEETGEQTQYAKISVIYNGMTTETELDIDIEADVISTIALAANTDLEELGALPTDIKQGERFWLGGSALKVSHADGSVEYLLTVPKINTTTGEVASFDWYAAKGTLKAETDIINNYLENYATFLTDLATEKAKETPSATNITTIASRFNAAATLFGIGETVTKLTDITDREGATKADCKITNNKIFITFDDTTKNGKAVVTYKGKDSSAIAVTVGQAVLGAIQRAAIVGRNDDTNDKTKYNGTRIVTASEFDIPSVGAGRTGQGATAAPYVWGANVPVGADTTKYSLPGVAGAAYKGNFSATTPYARNDIVVYNNFYYLCTAAGGHNGAWDDNLADFVAMTLPTDRTFSATTAYTVGTVVLQGEAYWVFTAAHAAGAWTGADAVQLWTATDDVFFFNLDATLTRENMVKTFKEDDATITVTLGTNTVDIDLATGLANGTFKLKDAKPLAAMNAGVNWLGFYYVDKIAETQTEFYLPIFVGNNLVQPTLDASSATKTSYMVGEALNKEGIKVTLTDLITCAVTEENKDLADLDTEKWSIYFNNGQDMPKAVTGAPTVAAALALASSVQVASRTPGAGFGTLVVYNVNDDIVAVTKVVNASIDNYVKSIKLTTEPTKTTYQVGFYPDGIGNLQARVPDVQKVFKGATLTLSFADKTEQKDVDIDLEDFIANGTNINTSGIGDAVNIDLNSMTGTQIVDRTAVDGRIIIRAKSGISTAQGVGKVGKIVYEISFEEGAYNASGVWVAKNNIKVEPVTFEVTAEQVGISTVSLYDGKPILDEDYYNDDGAGANVSPVNTGDAAEKYVANTEFYVGQRVNKNTVTRGYKVNDELGTNTGSFLVTFTDGKKQLVQYNADLANDGIIIDLPTIDATTEQSSRDVSFTYTVRKLAGRYEEYVSPKTKLTVSVTQDTLEELLIDNSGALIGDPQGMIVFYQGDKNFELTRRTDPDTGKVVEFDKDDHYYVIADYKHRGVIAHAFDLNKSTDLNKFEYADSDFATITANTGVKQVTLTYTAGGKTTELKLPVTVLEVPNELTIEKPEKTVFAKSEVVSITTGTVTLTKGGQNGGTYGPFKISDILADSDDLGDFKGKFAVQDEKQNVITDKTISSLTEGTHTLTFIYYTTTPNDPAKVATATLPITITGQYIATADWYSGTAPADVTGYVGGSLDFDYTAKGVGVKYTLSGAGESTLDLNLSKLPIYDVDENGNPTKTQLNSVVVANLDSTLKRSYITVTTYTTDESGKTKLVSDYSKKDGKNVFSVVGTHYIHIQLDDQALDYTVDVKAVEPSTIVLGTGTSAPKYGINDTTLSLKNAMFSGMDLIFDGGTATVTYNDGTTETIQLATDKRIGITGFDKDKVADSADAGQDVYVTFTAAGKTIQTETAMKIAVQKDKVKSIDVKTATGSASVAANYIQFYVGDSKTEFYKEQGVTVDLTYTSGRKLEGVDIANSDLKSKIIFTANTDTPLDDEIPYRDMTIKHEDMADADALHIYYKVASDEVTGAVMTTTETNFDALKKTIYKEKDAAIDKTGYKFDLTFASGKVYKKLTLADLGTGYTIGIAHDVADVQTVVVPDISKATAAQKALLTAGNYYLVLNYSEKLGSVYKIKEAAAPIKLNDANITYVEADDFATSLEVTAAPAAFGQSVDRITVNQYGYPNAEAFRRALQNDANLQITAYADIPTGATEKPVVDVGKRAEWTTVGDEWTFDASGIDFTTAGTNYTLKVTYQNVTKTIPVTVAARQLKEIVVLTAANYATYNTGNALVNAGIAAAGNVGISDNLVLGIGGDFEGVETTAGNNDPFYILPVFEAGGQGAPINLADEIDNIRDGKTSKVTIEPADTTTAGTISITVSYGGKETSIQATVENIAVNNDGTLAVNALAFEKLPTKLTYNANETPDLTGAVIIGNFRTTGGVPFDAEIKDLSVLGDLNFDISSAKNDGSGENYSANDAAITVGTYKYDNETYDIANAGADIIISKVDNIKDAENEKKIVVKSNIVKSITVSDVDTTYYLAYNGTYSKNTSDNKLINNIFTDNILTADQVLPNKALSESALESQIFDLKKGKVTVTYIDAASNPTINFDGNVTGYTGAGPIKVQINGAEKEEIELPTTKGTYPVKVYYKEAGIDMKSDNYTIEVAQDSIEKITMSAEPQETELIAGDSLNLTGAKVHFDFASGRKVDDIELITGIDAGILTVSEPDKKIIGEAQPITVTYWEYDADGREVAVATTAFDVTLSENKVKSIAITRVPNNLYIYKTSDDDFDFTGGKMTVTYERALSDGSTTAVIDMKEAYEAGDLKVITKVDFKKANEDGQIVKLEYLGQETEITVRVYGDAITGIKEDPDKPILKKVAIGDGTDAGLTTWRATGGLIISYELGKDKYVDLNDENVKVTGFNDTKPQLVDVTITYTEGEYTSEPLVITISVGLNKVKSITTTSETTIKLVQGDELDLSKIDATIEYDDADTPKVETNLKEAKNLTVAFFSVDAEGVETPIVGATNIPTDTVGTYRIKVTSTEDASTEAGLVFNVTVEALTVKSIKAENQAIRIGTKGTLALDAEKLTITYSNSKTEEATLGTAAKIKYTIKNSNGDLVADNKIDVEKEGVYTIYVTSVEDPTFDETEVITVTVSDKEISSFTLDKTELRIEKGDKYIDLTGIKATVTYTDATIETKEYNLIEDASKFIINSDAVQLDTVGTYDIIVTLKEDPTKTATIKVTVYAETIKELKVLPEAITIKKGTDLTDPTALAALLAPLNPTATITYTDGTTERTEELAIITNIDKFIIDASKVDTATVGTYDLTVALKEDITKTATIKVTVSDVTVKSFTVTPTTVKIKKGTDISDAAKLVAILTPLNPTATVVTVEDETEKTEEIAIITNVDKFVIDASKIDTTKTGDYDLTIALKADPTKTATIKVTVYDKVITDFKLSATTIEVKTGDAADYQKKYEAITVDIAYDEDGTASTASIALNADDARIKIEGSADISKAGVYPIIVRSTEDGTKFATLTITVVDGNKISDEDVDDVPEETPTINSRVVVFEKSGDEWTESKGFENLSAALDSKTGYGKGEGDYMFVIAGDISESSALKFPSKAKSITIVGDGKINLGKATTINIKGADISIDAEITGADLNVTLGAGKTLKIGERTKKLGKLTGNKSGSTLDVLGSTTIGNILTFSKVYASDGSIITIPAKGKVQNIGTLKAEIVLDGTATVSGTTVDEGIFHLTKNGAAKQPIAKVTLSGETKTFLDIIIDNEDTAIDGGMKVLYGSGKFNAAKNVNIINKDAKGKDLNAVSYNNNKEVRAENTEAITYQIGEGEELSTSSFEALFDLLKTETGEVTVTVNSDSVISKNNIPKKLKSLTIKGASDDVKVTCNLTSFKVSYDLHFEDIIIDAVNAKGALNAITISSNGSSMSFINTNINSKSISITGNKKNTTLLISGLSLVDKLQNFKEVVVTGSAFINKNFAVETLMLSFDSFISFGNSCVVKITKLSGEGVIGLEKPESPKKSKAITLTSSDITEEGAVQLVEIKRESLNSMFVIAVAQNEGSFSAGTQIFTDKSKGAIAYDKIFDATGLKDEGKLTNTKGKVVLS